MSNPQLSFHVIDDNISVRGMSRPWICTTVEARLGDEVIGYVHATHVTEESMRESYPTPWHFMRKEGWCIDLSDPVSVWAGCHRYAQKAPAWLDEASYNITAKHYPGPEQAEKDLADLLKYLDSPRRFRPGPTQRMAEFFEFHSEPFVDFSRVHDPYKRQGIATVMYEVLAKHLATKGLCLWEGLSNGCSGPLWEKMVASGRLPVSYRERPGSTDADGVGKKRHCMDYRATVAKAA